jgi:hypothetical protein
MITTIDLRILPEAQRNTVLGWYRERLKAGQYPMTLAEAADLYGYRPQTLRQLVAARRLKAKLVERKLMVTHQAMRSYIQGKRGAGAPRKAIKNAQVNIP